MATKKKVVKKAKAISSPQRKSASANADFWKFEFNMNSLYWLAIGLAIIAAALWIYSLNQETSDIYDEIDSSTTESTAPAPRQNATPPSY